MHAGRMSHPDNTPHHRQGVAPSAITPGEQIYTLDGMQDIPTPRALSTDEVRATVKDYAHAARRAVDAGADGVEIGADRTGIRLSPGFTGMGLNHGSERPDLFRYLVSELDKLGLAYIHIVHYGEDDILHDFRRIWRHALILNRPGRPREDIGKDVASGLADLSQRQTSGWAPPAVAASKPLGGRPVTRASSSC